MRIVFRKNAMLWLIFDISVKISTDMFLIIPLSPLLFLIKKIQWHNQRISFLYSPT